MEISDNLLCLYTGKMEKKGGSYRVEIPKLELKKGEIDVGEVYRVAMLPAEDTTENEAESEVGEEDGTSYTKPPVEEGERRTVEIESLGEQGDGIARVERGFVVIIPDTEKGERVSIEVQDVRENVAFAEVVERIDYYQ